MNWSSEWKTVGQLIDETVLPSDIVKGPTFDGNVWQHPIALFIIANEGEYPRQIEAIQVGHLAVHEHIKSEKEGSWQVTHVPTNTRFNAVPFGLHKKSDLIEWCKKVQAQNAEDWKALAELTTENYSSKIEAKDRIQELCLNTAVEE